MDNNRQQLVDNIRIAISEMKDDREIYKTVTSLIDSFSDGYNWTGFYIVNGDTLEVGPYIGPETQLKRIKVGEGICGVSAAEKKTIRVNDVNSDPRFIACSLTTKSEIVVPLVDGDKILGQIDIDSDMPGHFGEDDQKMLEAIASIVVDRLRETS